MNPSVKYWSMVIISLAGVATAGESAGVRKYTSPEGTVFEAVMVKGTAGIGEAAHRHVILIDTSASQVGEHRTHALGVLEGLLAKLPAGDQVKLVAVDVGTESLTAKFVSPQSEAMQSALDTLKARIPLGATNLVAGLHTAAGMLPDDQPGSIIYIGDGQSTAEQPLAADVQALVDQLRKSRIAVHSYGVGPQRNLHLLGIFAQQTGGAIAFDLQNTFKTDVEQKTAARGEKLAAAVQLPIVRPETLTAPAGATWMPPVALPLRSDRESIYLVRGELPAGGMISMSGPQGTLEWKLAAPIEGPQEAYLAALMDRVDREGGLSNSLAGAALLNLAKEEFAGRVTGLVNYGKLAFQRRDADRVQLAIDAVRQLDPANRELAQIEKSSQKLLARSVKYRQNAADNTVTPPSPAADLEAGDELAPRTEPNPNESLLEAEQRAIQIRTQRLRQQVSDVINAVRRSSEPQAALDEIDRTLTAVRSAIEVEPDVRQQLQKQLVSERLAQVNRQEVIERTRIRIQERQAQREAAERLAEKLSLEEERMAHLIDRVRALLDEARHGDDAAYAEAEAVARVAVDLRPGDGTSAAALFTSEAAQQLNRAYRLRARRADQFLETLHQVELSHIPFPDEPPVRFPPAAVWQALTERRRKWANVDLRNDSPNEVRIQAALDEQTEISFVETSLKDALEYIEDLHNIDIIVKETEITEDGGSADQQVNLELSGVKLRSALKLLLEPLGLDYVIADEVMQITTTTKAAERMSTRVYPVADLTVPIISGGMGGGMGGMGMGMMGGMGMGMMGGGMGGGMGMGGMGMGGMGMGGGMFSVPAEHMPAPILHQKKKR